MAGHCIFCQRQAVLTGEHIWSDWIGGLFANNEYVFQKRLKEGGPNKWKLSGLGVKARVVCRECNEGWMSDLESEMAKPLLSDIIRDGNAVCLLPKGASDLAAFTFKNAVVADHMDRMRKPFFSPAARDRFRRTLVVPPDIQIWAARFRGGGRTHGVFSAGYFNPRRGVRPLSNAEFYVFNWAAGHLVLQLLASRWKKLHCSEDEPPMLMPDPQWGAVAVKFWPAGPPIVWPPKKQLDLQSIQAFKSRWSVPILTTRSC